VRRSIREFLLVQSGAFENGAGLERKWFTSAAFRHALSLSIHRDDMARIAYRGYAHRGSGAVLAGEQGVGSTAP